jgi:hypothetical protein
MHTCLAGTDPCRYGYDSEAYGGGQQDQAGELFSDWDAHFDCVGEGAASGAEKRETTRASRASAEVEVGVESRERKDAVGIRGSCQRQTSCPKKSPAQGVNMKECRRPSTKIERNAGSDDRQSCCVSEKTLVQGGYAKHQSMERLSSSLRPD